MTTRQKIKVALLKALLSADGTPMPDAALVECGRAVFPTPTNAEVETARNELEADRLIKGFSNKITGVSWALTTVGSLTAIEL